MPAGIQAFDCLLAAVTIDLSAITVTPPPGWFNFATQATISTPDGQALALFGRIADGTESGTSPLLIWSASSAGDAVAIGAWSGRDPTKFRDAKIVATTNTTSNASPISCSITGDTAGTGDDNAVFLSIDNASGGNSQYSFSQITSYTNQATVNSTTFESLNFQYRDNLASGAFGPLATTATLTSGSGSAGYVALEVLMPALTLPLISSQPPNVQVNLWQTASFTVAAISSSGALSYQWQDDRSGSMANTSDGSGATTVTLTTPALPASANGRHYQCIVTDSNGSTITRQALLTVIPGSPFGGANPRHPHQGGLTWDLTGAEWF